METDYFLNIPRDPIFIGDSAFANSSSLKCSGASSCESMPGDVGTLSSGHLSGEKTRSKSEDNCVNTSKISNRPTTAVRKHVKKISEDFTLTQTNFENSSKPNSVKISVDRSRLLSPRIPKGLNAVNSSCAKCKSMCKSSSRGIIMPYIFPVVNVTSELTNASSLLSSPEILATPPINHPEQSNGNTPEEPLSVSTASCSPKRSKTSSYCLKKYDVYSPNFRLESKTSRRSSQRTSLSASSSPRLQQITLEQLKRARQFTERAIKEGRVFSIYGYFPAIRQALRSRGWVEKVLHRAPYVNPHPANCVCFQPYCTSALNTQAMATTAAGTDASAETDAGDVQATCVFPNVKGVAKQTCNFVERNRNCFKRTRSKRSDESVEKHGHSKSSQDESELNGTVLFDSNKQESHFADNNCDENMDSESSSSPSGNDSVTEPTGGTESNNLGQNHTHTVIEENQCNQEQNLKFQEGNRRKPRYGFNPSILCPEEIRNGIKNCINESNECLYSYTVPVYERPVQPTPSARISCDTQNNETDIPTQSVSQENMESNDKSKNVDEEVSVEDKNIIGSNKILFDPFNPYPDFNFNINEVDASLVGRLLKNVEPNLIWTWTKDSVSYKHLTKEQIVNRFPNTAFTTKHGLSDTMQQLHWFSEAACAETFVPRSYCIGQAEERDAFVQDYRLTACLAMLVWLQEGYKQAGYVAVADALGEVSLHRVRQAVQQVVRFVESCSHDHLDAPPPVPLLDSEWNAVVAAHQRLVHGGRRLRASQQQVEALVPAVASALSRVASHWPQLPFDGLRNLWIVKPGAQSRGRGIVLRHSLHDILTLVQSPFIYETKYVVQKYIERPFLVYNTKFDIRQWFLVTDWNPLTLWLYRTSYVRFCSQQYDLRRNDEAVHLSNNAIQCKYENGARSEFLPHENMWDSDTFATFLEESGYHGAWQDIVYSGMRSALIAAMLASQVDMDAFKHGFELYGADFMLSEDLRPWLIEINSSPCMAATSSVTRRLCAQCLHDIIKVVVDYRRCRDADTGEFELIYRDSQRVVPAAPYLGVNLQIIGKQVSRSSSSSENSRRCVKPGKPPEFIVKPLRMISLTLDSDRRGTPGSRQHDTPDSHQHDTSDSRQYNTPGRRQYDTPGSRQYDAPSSRQYESSDEVDITLKDVCSTK